jgi:preprotein translocase subunit SecF
VIISFSFFLILSDAEWSANFFLIQSENVTLYYRLCLVLIVMVNFLLTFVCEKVFIWYLSIYWKRRLDRKAQLQMNLEIAQQEAEAAAATQANSTSRNVYLPAVAEEEEQQQDYVEIRETEREVEEQEEEHKDN